jgi:hypothetical protein
LGKADNKAEALGLVAPNKEKILERLKVLRSHRWSSYRAYGNYGKRPHWLVTEELLRRAGGRDAYRKFVQRYVTRRIDPGEFRSLMERVAIGSQAFLEEARARVSTPSREQPDRSFVATRVSFDRIVAVVEDVKGESWSAFQNRYGDDGTALVLYLARMHSGLTLREIGEHAGGMDYKAVSARVGRFRRQLASTRSLRRIVAQCRKEM